MEKQKILFVDDDPRILGAMRAAFHRRFEVHTAQSPCSALKMLASDASFPVVVADLKMPEMNGIDFFRRAQEVSPESVRLMLTGQADLNAAMEAVNFGHVFRFHTKPCAPRILEQSVEDALRIFALSQAAPSDNMTARSRDETKESYDPKPPFKKTATEGGLTAEEIQFLIGNNRN